MPEAFTAAFAERLNSLCAIEVKEGQTGDEILPGRAIIAPGGKHDSESEVCRHFIYRGKGWSFSEPSQTVC